MCAGRRLGTAVRQVCINHAHWSQAAGGLTVEEEVRVEEALHSYTDITWRRSRMTGRNCRSGEIWGVGKPKVCVTVEGWDIWCVR